MKKAKVGGNLAASDNRAEGNFLTHMHAGDLEQASRSCGNPGTARMIRSTRATIATVKAIRAGTGDADIADACTRILRAIAQLSRNWVARTPAEMPEDLPSTEAELCRLLVNLLEDGHYYQPVPLSGVEGKYTSLVTPAYLEQAWDLLRPVLPDMKGAAVLEVGPAEGFFTTRFARAGAAVTAIERNLLMAVRAITFSALNGLQARVRVHIRSRATYRSSTSPG
jgi:2-polyprenyl-3-methyl-5-hydroxy-6-metoxy-1,4-benzoquinol methylase